MKRNPKIGLLPLYLKLYDDALPEKKAEFIPLIDNVVQGFEGRGIDVARAEICRTADEFQMAVGQFEDADIDCIVTLHLAYSPSLECIDALAGTELPILILDATMDEKFGTDVEPDRIMYNHGIHGVMDMACMLRRRSKKFRIVAGYIGDAVVLDRAASTIRAARAATCMAGTKVLRIGDSFKGMGDFYVEAEILKNVLGIDVDQIDTDQLAASVATVTDDEVEQELAADKDRFVCEVPEDIHRRSLRVCLGVRKILEAGQYNAFSMNFLAFSADSGPVDTVPFLEACKGMARGLGYAGEGDVLTASLVGALAQGFGDTTFTEIFCPDWSGNSLFLSHMGEINPALAADQPHLIEYEFPFTPARNPTKLTCCLKAGPATFVDIVPGPDDTFSLVVARVEILGDTTVEEMKKSIRAWIRPEIPVEQFLERYSQHGGTHHSALVLGDQIEGIQALADFMGMQCNVISA